MIAVSAVLIMASCSKKTNTQGRYIPKEALFAMHINGESLTAKLPWDEVKNNNAFKMAYADSSVDAIARAAMDNPENTGIDIKNDLVFFVVKDTTGGYAGFQGKLKDAAKFKSYFTSAFKDAAASEKDGIQFLTKDQVSITWDKDKFIVLSDLPQMGAMNALQRNAWDTSYNAPMEEISTRNLPATATALYNLKEGNSLATEERFSKLMADKGDMHFWMNAESLSQEMSGMSGLAMMNLNKISEDSRQAATASFEDGKIKVDLTSYGGKEMTNLYKKYGGGKVSEEMAAQLPTKDAAIFFAMNFKPEGIKEFLKLLNLEGMMNMVSGQIGFTFDDFIKANKGDLLLSISDFTKDSFGRPNPKVLFATSIGDKVAFDKLIAAGNKMSRGAAGFANEFSYNKNDQYFVIGNDKAANDQFVTGKSGNKPAFWDKISGGAVAGYVNIQTLMNSFRSEMSNNDSFMIRTFQASQKMWNDITLSGGEFKDGGIVQHVEINLMDKSTNSLKQLNRYFDEIALIQKQRKESYKYMYEDVTTPKIDSVIFDPVVAP